MNIYDLIPPNCTRHFRATPEFLQWWKDYVGDKPVFEVGAGCCDFTIQMHHLGIRAAAIEPRANDEVRDRCANFLFPADVYDAQVILQVPSIVVAARPDHSGWVGDVPDLIHKDSKFIYIGLEKNIQIDLDRDYHTLYTGAGEDGEVVIHVL